MRQVFLLALIVVCAAGCSQGHAQERGSHDLDYIDAVFAAMGAGSTVANGDAGETEPPTYADLIWQHNRRLADDAARLARGSNAYDLDRGEPEGDYVRIPWLRIEWAAPQTPGGGAQVQQLQQWTDTASSQIIPITVGYWGHREQGVSIELWARTYDADHSNPSPLRRYNGGTFGIGLPTPNADGYFEGETGAILPNAPRYTVELHLLDNEGQILDKALEHFQNPYFSHPVDVPFSDEEPDDSPVWGPEDPVFLP